MNTQVIIIFDPTQTEMDTNDYAIGFRNGSQITFVSRELGLPQRNHLVQLGLPFTL